MTSRSLTFILTLFITLSTFACNTEKKEDDSGMQEDDSGMQETDAGIQTISDSGADAGCEETWVSDNDINNFESDDHCTNLELDACWADSLCVAYSTSRSPIFDNDCSCVDPCDCNCDGQMSVQCVSKELFMLECRTTAPVDCPTGYTCHATESADGGVSSDAGSISGLCVEDAS